MATVASSSQARRPRRVISTRAFLGEIVPDYRPLHLGRRFAHCQQVFETVRAEGCEMAEKVNGFCRICFALRVFTDN